MTGTTRAVRGSMGITSVRISLSCLFDGLLLPVLACTVAGCSVNATHADRCGAEDACPVGRICHAGFCVGSDAVALQDAQTSVLTDASDSDGHVASRDGGMPPSPPATPPPAEEPPSTPPPGPPSGADGGATVEPACRSGESCVGDQLAVCEADMVIGTLACTASSECMVARCEDGRGCVSTSAPDGTACSGGRCENGHCQASQTCAGSNCKTECLETGTSCTLECGSSSNCDAHCAAGTTCDVQCGNTSNCELKCQGNCAVACDQASNCRADCREGSCDIACPESGNCDEVRCRDGAACLLRCQTSDKCEFKECDGEVFACSATLMACNRGCP
jgi:hypothetical protein